MEKKMSGRLRRADMMAAPGHASMIIRIGGGMIQSSFIEFMSMFLSFVV